MSRSGFLFESSCKFMLWRVSFSISLGRFVNRLETAMLGKASHPSLLFCRFSYLCFSSCNSSSSSPRLPLPLFFVSLSRFSVSSFHTYLCHFVSLILLSSCSLPSTFPTHLPFLPRASLFFLRSVITPPFISFISPSL